MTHLDDKKNKLKLMRAETNIVELEIKIEERKEDILRMEEHIQKQIEVIAEAKESK